MASFSLRSDALKLLALTLLAIAVVITMFPRKDAEEAYYAEVAVAPPVDRVS